MERYEIRKAVMAFFNAQWVANYPAVAIAYENRRPAKQTPNPADPAGSAWIRPQLMDIDGPNLGTYGGSLYSDGHVFFTVFTAIDVGSGYADDLLDGAIALLRGKTTGKIQFLPRSETYSGYPDENELWWMAMGRVPFIVRDDDPDAPAPTVSYPVITAFNGPMRSRVFGTTVDATPTELFTDGVSQRLTIEQGVSSSFTVDVFCPSAHYVIKGRIQNSGGTVSLVGGLDKTILHEASSGYDATVLADDTNDALVVQVTGAGHWEAVFDFNRSVP